jgi:hypothetical protein
MLIQEAEFIDDLSCLSALFKANRLKEKVDSPMLANLSADALLL